MRRGSMGKYYELKPEEVRKICPEEMLPFRTTKELETFTDIIGQERAAHSMEYGLKIQKKGYNIFMVGTSGSGKATYAQAITKRIAQADKTPDDWCYVYNFEQIEVPLALSFPAGEGKEFAKRVKTLLERLIFEITAAFENENYEKEKSDLLTNYKNQKKRYMDDLEYFTKEKGFILQEKKSGIVTMPSFGDRPITEEEYEELSEAEREKYKIYSEQIQEKALEIFRDIKIIEKKYKDDLEKLNQDTGKQVIDQLFQDIFKKFYNRIEVMRYLKAFKQDVLDSIADFRQKDSSLEFSFLTDDDTEGKFLRYQVNLFIDNSELKGAPVIYETNPSFYRLMGKVEYISRAGSLVTSFMQIKPGAIHKANGGYLILSVKDLLLNRDSWNALKRVLKTESIVIENLGESYGLVAVASLRPAPISLNLKIILMGNPRLYYLLLNLDEDFRKLFKIKVDFSKEMNRNYENIMKFAQFLKYYTEEMGMLPFDKGAVAEVIEFSSRLAGKQDKLSTKFNQLIELITEAEAWARLESVAVVTRNYVKRANQEKIYRNSKAEEFIQKNIHEGTFMIECSGRRVGQVNALVVADLNDYTFGYPTKVTSVVYKGKRGVIHIERETKMSGAIHDKGLITLSNFLGARYAQEKPLSLSASIAFEQVYNKVDGDSASCAELSALISSLAQVPILQNIAVTGSMNQHGEIQPIGGVVEKIEGFFKSCTEVGLTGDQGVIIPYQNINNLMLGEEVVSAIAQDKFHIYPIRDVDEGIEILTGLPVGHKRRDGTYPRNTINYFVSERLKKFSDEDKRD